jgi:hypothetical protein
MVDIKFSTTVQNLIFILSKIRAKLPRSTKHSKTTDKRPFAPIAS